MRCRRPAQFRSVPAGPRGLIGIALAVAVSLVLGSAGDAAASEVPNRDPRNWPTLSRLIGDRYEVAGQVFTLRVHARKTDYFNCGYRGAAGRLMAFTLLGGPYETMTGYLPRELGIILERTLQDNPWAPITVEVRFDPERLSDLCPGQVDILKWSRGWQYPPDSLTPGRPDTSLQPTPDQLAMEHQKALWKELRQLDSPHVGQRIQLTAGARVSTAYHCAFQGATRTHFALRLHDGTGRFIHAYLLRDARSRKLMDFVALHRDVRVAVEARVVKLALSSYCRPQLEVAGWSLPDQR